MMTNIVTCTILYTFVVCVTAVDKSVEYKRTGSCDVSNRLIFALASHYRVVKYLCFQLHSSLKSVYTSTYQHNTTMPKKTEKGLSFLQMCFGTVKAVRSLYLCILDFLPHNLFILGGSFGTQSASEFCFIISKASLEISAAKYVKYLCVYV